MGEFVTLVNYVSDTMVALVLDRRTAGVCHASDP
jgi:hypothetical protein